MTFYQAEQNLKLLLFVAILLAVLLFLTEKSACEFDDQPENILHIVINLMTSFGYENIRASMLSDTLNIEYENRVYLREKDVIGVIVPKLMNVVPNIQTLRLIPKRYNFPLLFLTVSRSDYLETIAKKQSIFDVLKISQIIASPIREEKIYNSSSGKVDIIIHPSVNIILGKFVNPFIPQYAISPEISVYCGKGIRSIARLKSILYDELKKDNRSVVLDGLYVDYTYKRSALKSIDLSAGYFGMNRYGINSATTLLGLYDEIGIGCSIAYLGNIYYQDNTIYMTKLWNWTALADLYYKLPFWNMLLTAEFGRFLYQDIGISGEITRFYKNVSLDAFATKTNKGSTLGIRIQLLTYPRRNMKPNHVQVKLPAIINMEYRYKYRENIVGIKFSPKYNNVDNVTDNFWLMNFKD
jgi:hypothetical protein